MEKKIFLKISPYETTVPTLEQVPNYNVQVSAWWVTLIFLEFVVLKISQHEDRFARFTVILKNGFLGENKTVFETELIKMLS